MSSFDFFTEILCMCMQLMHLTLTCHADCVFLNITVDVLVFLVNSSAVGNTVRSASSGGDGGGGGGGGIF